MKKTIVLSISMAVITLFSSCEGGTTFSKGIENRTSETIKVKLHTIYGNIDETTINPSDTKQIFWDDQMGFFVDDSYTCTQLIDSVEIDITNGKILIKDIMNSDNWERTSKGGRNSKEACLFIISNDDIL
jgi:hypothetical protein